MKHRTLTALVLLLMVLPAGAETRVRIVGMASKSEDDVFALMSGRLVHVTTKRASPSRADDAAFLVRQVLRNDGYADARVSWKIANSAEIVLTVAEGGRLSLGTVTIQGPPTRDARRLSRLYARPAEKDRPIISGPPPFREQDVETGLSFIRQDLNAQGFWDAQATVTSRAIDPATGRVDLTIDVQEGAVFKIVSPEFTSPDGRGLAEARAAVKPYLSRTATTGNINAMRLAVEQTFSSTGYPNSRISMSRTLVTPRFIAGFDIDLGKRVWLNRVQVDGLVRTNPRQIANRMKRLEGNWYDEAAMNKRIRGLLATGAFSSARVETEGIGDDRIDALLHLEEGRAREVSVAVGGDSYQGPILRTTYTDRNLWGELLGFSTGFEFSSRGVLGETRLTDPWFMGTDISATARVYALIYGREGYSSLETGIDGTASLAVNDHYKVELLAGYSLVNLSSDGLPTSELGETVYTQPRLRFTQTLDYRDNPILPTKGWHLVNPIEIGAALGDMSTSYLLAEISGGWFRAIGRDFQLVLGGAVGAIVPSGDSADLPIDLRLFNGGARSVRSFPERELGPRVNGFPTGGEARWHANAELIRGLAGSLKAVG
ncbi:BamA/TamA family outer membrane protein, partial [bacterium]|nr:BamA/TamA family outer membrane protein [bacterium]